MKKIVFSILLAIMFIGCGGSSGTSPDNNSNTTSSSSSSYNPFPDDIGDNSTGSSSSIKGIVYPSQDKSLKNWFQNNLTNYMYMGVTYEVQPDRTNCKPGKLTKESQEKHLELVNKIRALSGLYPLVLSNEATQEEMQAVALMMDVNGKLDHHPTSDWECYSAKGANGAGRSNLALGYQTLGVAIVVGWLQDKGVCSLGHRRWMVAPTMRTTSFGAVGIGYAMETLQYFYNDKFNADIIAVPYGEYPYEVIGDARWSLSFPQAGLIDLSSIHVYINGIDTPYKKLGGNFGTGQTISFPVNAEQGKTYKVKVIGIKGWKANNIEYTVTLY